MEGTIYSLIPPLVALTLVLVTRKVILSLGIGVVAGAFMINQFELVATAKYLGALVAGLAATQNDTGEWALNVWNMSIIGFLFLLGVVASYMQLNGGSRAFGQWTRRVVKTRKGAQAMTGFFGVLIFFDDYFNSLAVGNMSRPMTDSHRVSRAKLAYILDSTAAPMCVISPVSSWGAYIIALIGGILTTHHVQEYGAIEAFIRMIPMNLYAIAALLMVFFVAYKTVDIGPMKIHETRARRSGELLDPERKEPVPGEAKGLPESQKGTIYDLIVPIVALIIGTLGSMIYTGFSTVQEAGGAVTVFSVFENTKVAVSLLYGGIIGFVVTFVFTLFKAPGAQNLFKGFVEGIKAMMPAVLILLFAWMTASVISDIQTGAYLASFVNGILMPALLPALLFVISGVMAFATGTSWGTFGILLPISGQIAAETDPNFILPVMAAVLAGSVFGDHCSPISDTTVLSSIGAGCHHIDHVTTQIPYALVCAALSLVGFLVLGFAGNVVLSLVITLLLLVFFVFLIGRKPDFAKS